MIEFFSALLEALPGPACLTQLGTNLVIASNQIYRNWREAGFPPQNGLFEVSKEIQSPEMESFLFQYWTSPVGKSLGVTSNPLVVNLTHEMNNSLQAILIFSHLGKEISGNSPQEQKLKEFLDKIKESAEIVRSHLHRLNAIFVPKESREGRGRTTKNQEIGLSPWETIKTKVIWIIDDDLLTLESIGEILFQRGLTPLLLADPVRALELRPLPDCIICDYNLGSWDGIQIIQKIRALKPEIASILLSGRSLCDTYTEELESQNILARTKPIAVEELEEAILLAFGFL